MGRLKDISAGFERNKPKKKKKRGVRMKCSKCHKTFTSYGAGSVCPKCSQAGVPRRSLVNGAR